MSGQASCYACGQPTEWFATRCPHCTSQLNGWGARHPNTSTSVSPFWTWLLLGLTIGAIVRGYQTWWLTTWLGYGIMVFGIVMALASLGNRR